MKLVMIIMNDEDAFPIMDMLNSKGFMVTKLATTGGVLRSGNTTLICGIKEEDIPVLLEVVESKCKSRKQITSVNSMNMNASESFAPYPVEVTVGGATLFILNVDQFLKIN